MYDLPRTAGDSMVASRFMLHAAHFKVPLRARRRSAAAVGVCMRKIRGYGTPAVLRFGLSLGGGADERAGHRTSIVERIIPGKCYKKRLRVHANLRQRGGAISSKDDASIYSGPKLMR